MGVSTIPASGGGGLTPKYVKYTSSGTFTLPDGYGAANPLVVTIQCIGGGGGGSSAVINAASANRLGSGNFTGYFGWGTVVPMRSNITGNTITRTDSGAAGSGGLAQSVLSLTSNLTFTVGTAGARTITEISGDGPNANTMITNNVANGASGTIASQTGGTGGTSTAGVLKASGGAGQVTSMSATFNNKGSTNNTDPVYANSISGGGSSGAGGTPAGTNGTATPLLGALAGGSQNTTPINGAFGVGGKSDDLATSTGADGTGGGHASIGASGAIIITYWA